MPERQKTVSYFLWHTIYEIVRDFKKQKKYGKNVSVATHFQTF